jgi:ABC-2 type transport system permease protein
MRPILLVAGQEFIVNLRRPGFIIMTLLVPAFGVLAMLVASLFGGQVAGALASQFAPTRQVIGFVDLSGVLSADLPQYAGQYARYPDEAPARADLLAGKIDSYLVVPSDYLETGEVMVYSTGGGFSTFAAADNGNLRSFLLDHLLTGRIDPTLQERIQTPIELEAIALDQQGAVSAGGAFSWLGDFVVPYVFSILFMITIFTSSGFLLQSVSEEKEGRIIEILLSSISPTQLLAGKILALGALGLVQVLFWLGVGVAGIVQRLGHIHMDAPERVNDLHKGGEIDQQVAIEGNAEILLDGRPQ